MSNFKALLDSNLQVPETIQEATKGLSFKVSLNVKDYKSKAGGDLEMMEIYAERDTISAINKASEFIQKKVKRSIPFSIRLIPSFIGINKGKASFDIEIEGNMNFINELKRVL